MRALLALVAVTLAACTCSSGPSAVGSVQRCVVGDPPAPRSAPVGDVRVVVEDRVVRLEGLTAPVRLVAVGGAAIAGEPFAPALDAIEERDPDVIVLLGSVGDDEATRREALSALATLSVPTLILPGARDELSALRASMAEISGAERLVDLGGVRLVQVGDVALVPAPGAPDGRYTRTDAACALAPDDVEAIAGALPEGAPAARVLLSWASPAGHPASRGAEGTDVGSTVVRDLAARIGAIGGIAVWPPSAVAEHAEGDVSWVIAVPAVGPAVEGPEGDRRASGPLTVLLTAEGAHVEPSGAEGAP